MRLKSFQNNRGVISVFVLLLCFLYLSLGLSILALELGGFQDSYNILDSVQARLMAESALQEARYYAVHIDPAWVGTSPEHTVSPNGKAVGSYQYSIAKTGNIYDVTAMGYVPHSTAQHPARVTLTQRFRNPNPLVIFQDGFESGDLSSWAGQTSDVGTTWDVISTAPKNGIYHARGQRTVVAGSELVAQLLSPVFDLSAYDSVVLRFSWRSSVGGTRFRVSQNSGSGWSSIYDNATADYANAYIRPAVRIPLSSLTHSVQFRFEAHLSSITDLYYLDDVQLSSPYAIYDPLVD